MAITARSFCALSATLTLAMTLTACGEKEPDTFTAKGSIVDITNYYPKHFCTGNLGFYERIFFEDLYSGDTLGQTDITTLVEGRSQCVYTFNTEVEEAESGMYLIRAGFYPIAKVSKSDLMSGEDIIFEDDE